MYLYMPDIRYIIDNNKYKPRNTKALGEGIIYLTGWGYRYMYVLWIYYNSDSFFPANAEEISLNCFFYQYLHHIL